jgi:hypothetical protein
VAHGRICKRKGFNVNCNYCSKSFHSILESLRPLMDLSGGDMSSTPFLSVLILTFHIFL